MKIGVVTIPPRGNYGGALQAYALNRVLRNMGHDTYLIMPKMNHFRLCPLYAPFVYAKRAFRRYILGDYSVVLFLEQKLIKEYYVLYQEYIKFIDDNIEQYYCIDYNDIPSNIFDALVVGSDQIWRAKLFSNLIANYCLSFAKDWDIKRFAYAASFGVDNISEYSPELLAQCRELVKLFDGISVREDSAVNLCREYLGVEAEHLLDPTMLLDKEHYEELLKDEPKIKGKLVEYIFDRSDDTELISQKCCKKLNLDKVSLLPQKLFIENQNIVSLDDCVLSSTQKWLAGIRNAEFIISDSFHVVVFSIIFNKPFIVIINENRGIARIDSLLRMFGLESRVVENSSQLNESHFSPIDYVTINTIKRGYQKKSYEFLNKIE